MVEAGDWDAADVVVVQSPGRDRETEEREQCRNTMKQTSENLHMFSDL